MKKIHSLRKNKQFQYIYRKGKSQGCKTMVLLWVRSGDQRVRVGFSVSKKVGGAVTRNLVKRRLKAILTEVIPTMKGGQYVIVARKEAADAPFAILSRDVRYLLKKGDYLKQPLSQEHVEQNKKSLDMQ